VPFTGSHPAAVLPLLRAPLPASALVIGSLAPDVPFYLPGRPDWDTHSALAVGTTDVLVGLVVWLLWHGLLAAPALAAAPAGLRARLVGRVPVGLGPRLRPGRLVPVPVAVVVGAATHVLWDAFTHGGAWGSERIAALRVTLGGLPVHDWAQHGSSVVGAAALAWWLRRWWRRTAPVAVPAPGRSARGVWPGLLGLAAVVGVGAALGAPDPGSAAFAGATAGGGAAGGAALVLAAAWHVRRRVVGARPGG
jgi:uncharacterized protein DUF4184